VPAFAADLYLAADCYSDRCIVVLAKEVQRLRALKDKEADE
jgi:hypothetical protein